MWVLVPEPDEQGRKNGLVTCYRANNSLPSSRQGLRELADDDNEG